MPPKKSADSATNGARSAGNGSNGVDIPAPEQIETGAPMAAAQEPAAETGNVPEPAGLLVVRADHVDVRQAAVRRVEALDVSMTQGAIGMVRADRVSLVQGGIGLAAAESVDLRQGTARLVIARGPVHLEQAFARTVVAGDVEMGGRSFAGLVIAREVRGEGRILLDWRAGLALGAALVLGMTLLRGRRR